MLSSFLFLRYCCELHEISVVLGGNAVWDLQSYSPGSISQLCHALVLNLWVNLLDFLIPPCLHLVNVGSDSIRQRVCLSSNDIEIFRTWHLVGFQ